MRELDQWREHSIHFELCESDLFILSLERQINITDTPRAVRKQRHLHLAADSTCVHQVVIAWNVDPLKTLESEESFRFARLCNAAVWRSGEVFLSFCLMRQDAEIKVQSGHWYKRKVEKHCHKKREKGQREKKGKTGNTKFQVTSSLAYDVLLLLANDTSLHVRVYRAVVISFSFYSTHALSLDCQVNSLMHL